jgi:hypothetical protein
MRRFERDSLFALEGKEVDRFTHSRIGERSDISMQTFPSANPDGVESIPQPVVSKQDGSAKTNKMRPQ